MIVVTNRLHVAPDYVPQFEERFRNRSRMIDDMPGFIRNQVLRPTREGDPYIILTMWESHEHFEAWTNSDAFKKAHSGGEAQQHIYTAPNHVEIYEVIMDTAEA
jgi:heme-degrading monooxygenase HmoA